MTDAPATKRPKRAFGGVPARAVLDDRLEARHWRALVAIALHDGFSVDRGSAGCTVAFGDLALKVGSNIARFSTTVADLAEWGYVTKQATGRGRTLRIVYLDLDLDMTPRNGVWRRARRMAMERPTRPPPKFVDTLHGRQTIDADETLPAMQSVEAQHFACETGQVAEIVAIPSDNILGEALSEKIRRKPVRGKSERLNVEPLVAPIERRFREHEPVSARDYDKLQHLIRQHGEHDLTEAQLGRIRTLAVSIRDHLGLR